MANYRNTIQRENDVLVIFGDLDFNSVDQIWRESLKLLPECKELCFDLSHVASANSAALALLLEWKKYATQQKKRIRFQHIPSQLLAIAKVSGVEKFLS